MDEASARAICGWRYEAPYHIYNVVTDGVEGAVLAFLDPQYAYYCIVGENGDLVAYCCFGLDARVPGGDYSRDALDVGMGVRPDLTGQGLGLSFAQAVLRFARETFEPPAYRVTVARFNERAQRVWEKAGFQQVEEFARSSDGMPFVIMIGEG
jgi:RimJ/RimL family protein N-acetyltransferase